MANLPENAVWEAGIYQLETTDPVQGGPNGIDNLQAKQLGNRLLYLKNLVDGMTSGKLNVSALATQAQAVAGTDNATWMTPLRVAQAIAALSTIAMASDTVAGKVELATVAETITGTDTQRATHPAGVKAAVDAAVAAVVASSPAALNTLNELAAALGNDPNFATSITNLIAGRQPLDATLSALAGMTVAADKLIYATGTDAFSTTTLTAFARTLLDDADAAAALATLGISTGYASQLANPGYIKLPTWLGGLIIQWGYTANFTKTLQDEYTEDTYTSTFPLAFPNAVLTAYTTMNGDPHMDATAHIDSLSTTQIVIRKNAIPTSASGTAYARWLAIGY